ncbi:unnamed protein product [Parnassius apollo]|uniref:(apollo) hypothetical protein n=1 Tax=Parnassius apollo TaxID=110799 RepID=A0A8S3X424_PARAO|nr:unnamed protein product [Parnassius apollo]
MDQFLTTTTNKLKSSNYSEITIILGNESCDLDSAVTALVYAMFLSWQYDQIKCKVCTKSHRDESTYKESIYVPVLDVEREDFSLKTEVVYCLKDHGISEDSLVFRNDIDIKNLLASSTKTNIILVDHHILSKKYDFLAPYVTEIIDHRPFDKKEWNYKEDTRSLIETVGSCATLVAQRMKDLSALIEKNFDFFTTYPSCTKLLHCAIILDTVNFSKDINKGTPHDKEIVEFLESILKLEDREAERKSILDRLLNARCDVSPLTASQLMRKDVKIVGDVLVPSFPIPVKEFLKKPGALQAVSEALQRCKCSIGLLLGMRLSPVHLKDVAVYGPGVSEKAAKLAKYLQDWGSPSFQLSPEDPGAGCDGCFYYHQLYSPATRKQYIPVVVEFLQSYME